MPGLEDGAGPADALRVDDERTTLALAADPALVPAPVAVPADASLDAAPAPAPDRFSFTAVPAAPVTTPAGAPAEGAPRPRVPVAAVRSATALAVLVLTGFFVLIVSGRVVTEGPVVLVLSRTHGIHLGDLVALGAWCLAVVPLVVTARR